MRRLLFHRTSMACSLASKLAIVFAALGVPAAASAARACPVHGVCSEPLYAPIQQVVVPQYVAPVQSVQVQTYAVPLVQRQIAVQAYTAPVRQVVLRQRLFRRPLLQRQVIRSRGVAAGAAVTY